MWVGRKEAKISLAGTATSSTKATSLAKVEYQWATRRSRAGLQESMSTSISGEWAAGRAARRTAAATLRHWHSTPTTHHPPPTAHAAACLWGDGTILNRYGSLQVADSLSLCVSICFGRGSFYAFLIHCRLPSGPRCWCSAEICIRGHFCYFETMCLWILRGMKRPRTKMRGREWLIVKEKCRGGLCPARAQTGCEWSVLVIWIETNFYEKKICLKMIFDSLTTFGKFIGTKYFKVS